MINKAFAAGRKKPRLLKSNVRLGLESSLEMERKSVFRDASIGCIREDYWCVYADGFLRAAEILVENIRTTYELNTVVFPVLFMYRQYIELSLKELHMDVILMNPNRVHPRLTT